MKIGIMGMSPGNAHPYSWSSIINGCFDPDEITCAGYPAVAAYLRANSDTLGMPRALVTHVWTQDPAITASIARSAGIGNQVTRAEDMIGQVDAVLLTRDDPENHVAMAKPFLEAGIPLFIDKPLAATRNDLAFFSDAHAKGRFFMSCSSMRYASEVRTLKIKMASLGPVELITATGKKDWTKYGVHMLEAVMLLLDDAMPLSVKHISEQGRDIVHLSFENGLQVLVNLFMDICPTFQLTAYGQQGWRMAEIENSYAMFRDNIIEFIRSVEEGAPRLIFKKTEQIIRILIAARESLEQGGRTVPV